jgi:membrane-bound lytic murein transglycosylase B
MKAFLILALLLPGMALAQAGYSTRPEVRAFIREVAQRHGFKERELRALFARVERAEPVLEAIKRPPDPPVWSDYRALFLTEKRIETGVAFWQTHQSLLERAEREFGVPAQVMVAIIGVETFYGRNTGRWRVIDALTTLAFDYPPRAKFFRSELEHYLVLARQNKQDALSVRGSYAGAIGIPQFMPSSTRAYAVDFDGDGVVDLRASTADAIGSVASFLKQHGWQAGTPVQLKPELTGDAWRALAGMGVELRQTVAELRDAGVLIGAEMPGEMRAALIDFGTEQRVALRNFYVISRYNRSVMYAAAVADLAEALRASPQSPGR